MVYPSKRFVPKQTNIRLADWPWPLFFRFENRTFFRWHQSSNTQITAAARMRAVVVAASLRGPSGTSAQSLLTCEHRLQVPQNISELSQYISVSPLVFNGFPLNHAIEGSQILCGCLSGLHLQNSGSSSEEDFCLQNSSNPDPRSFRQPWVISQSALENSVKHASVRRAAFSKFGSLHGLHVLHMILTK